MNWTESQDVKVNKMRFKKEQLYANTQKQPLVYHLLGVGILAGELVNQLLPNNKVLAQAAYISGCLHDIGKVDPKFRCWVDDKISKNNGEELSEIDGTHIDKGNFSFEKHPRHNEISLWLMQFINLEKIVPNRVVRVLIEHAVYWHHAKPIRRDAYNNLNDIHTKLKSTYKTKGLTALTKSADLVMQEITEIIGANSIVNLSKLRASYDDETASDFRKTLLPEYKQYDLAEEIDEYASQVMINAKLNIIRTCVITADRKISALTSQQLRELIKNDKIPSLASELLDHSTGLTAEIENCLLGFDTAHPNSKRNADQFKAAKDLLAVEDVAVLNGPAGCGKTKIALEWAKLSGVKKIIWICPRVQVCEGLFADLTGNEYLPNANIEICTGEIKQQSRRGKIDITQEGNTFSGDIILTTIDQVINGITTHTYATSLLDFINSHVVFDEYHEYIPMPAFNILFGELVRCKQLLGSNSKTLLVSATPNYIYIERFLKIDRQDIIHVKSFNESKYKLVFESFDEDKRDSSNPLYAPQPDNTFVISNTASTAQLSYITNQRNENSILFHGKYKGCDKRFLFNKVFHSFKRNGSQDYKILRSGPIIQASLNITCSKIVTEFTVAESWLQRLGRLDRFGESDKVNHFVTAIPSIVISSNGKIKGNCARFLNSSNVYKSAYEWYQFLQSKIVPQPLTIDHIYQLYDEFYQSRRGIEAVEYDLTNALRDSVRTINHKVHDPIRLIQKKSNIFEKKLKKSNLRGDSRFIQMAKMKLNDDGSFSLLNEYAVNWHESDPNFENCYTESIDNIRNNGLIDYAAKKQGRVTHDSPLKGISKTKIGLRKQVLEGAAVSPKQPIYLSYTPNDLSEYLGETTSDPAAIYYAINQKQVIGAISIDKIQNKLGK